jgi:hypothetical protein
VKLPEELDGVKTKAKGIFFQMPWGTGMSPSGDQYECPKTGPENSPSSHSRVPLPSQ